MIARDREYQCADLAGKDTIHDRVVEQALMGTIVNVKCLGEGVGLARGAHIHVYVLALVLACS